MLNLKDPKIATKRKRRPSSACESCRRKKVKCDRNSPCEQCLRAKNEEDCVYLLCGQTTAKNITSTNRPVGTATVESTSCPRFVAHRSPFSRFNNKLGSDKSQAAAAPLGSEPRKTSIFSREAINSNFVSDREEKENNSDRESSIASSTAGDDVELRGIFTENCFFGQSHWYNSAHQFPQVFKGLQKLDNDKSCDLRALYESCQVMSNCAKITPHQTSGANLVEHIPSRKVGEPLIQAYLRTFESVFRILHRPSFLSECNKFWINPTEVKEEVIVQILLVMSIGIVFSAEDNCEAASTWINTAQSWLGCPTDPSRVTIASVQIFCLLLLARQSNNVGADFIWISAGALLRTAMQIGLHINPDRLTDVTCFNKEIRRRLWATVLEISLQSAMDSGGLPLLSIDDCDNFFPSNIPDEDFNAEMQMLPLPKGQQEITQTSLQIELMKSFPTRLKIARLLNSFRTEYHYNEVLQLSSELSAYCQSNFLRYNSQKFTFSTRLLELLTVRFLLALHHPFAMKARHDPTMYFSRKVSLEVSLSLLARFSQNSTSPQERDYARLGLMGAGIFRAVPVQAANTICEDLIRQLEEDSFSFTAMSSSFSQLNLRSIVADYLNMLSTRLSISETTIHGCMKFSALIAQIDALQSGTSVEMCIMEALKKSIEQCHTILQNRHSNPSHNPPDSGYIGQEELEDMIVGVDDRQDWLGTDLPVCNWLHL